MNKSKRMILAIGALSAPVPANAADWLMLQGTEPQDVSHRYFGAIQATYANYIGCSSLSGLAAADGTPTGNFNAGQGLNNGRYNNNCTNGPKFSGPVSVAVDTLMLGARETLFRARSIISRRQIWGQTTLPIFPRRLRVSDWPC